MDINTTGAGTQLTVSLNGRLDAEAAPALARVLDTQDNEITSLIIDCTSLTFLASAGLRVLLTAQKSMLSRGNMVIRNVSKDVMQVFRVTGFADMMRIEEAPRHISLDGARLIGQGVTGECYRLDNETLLKLYFSHIPSNVPYREKAYAKAAFMADIPTAISFDLVTCNGRNGILYEMLNAQPLSNVIVEDQSSLAEYVKRFADLCKTIHTTPGSPDVFPSTKHSCLKAIETVDFLSSAQRNGIMAKVNEIDDRVTCVHGDLHTSNILLKGDDLYLIDMGDFSIGDPMFDIGQIFNIFYSSQITGISRKAVGMAPDLAFTVWELFEEYYFEATTEQERKQIRKDAAFFGCLRMFMFYDAFGKDQNMKRWLLERFVPEFT